MGEAGETRTKSRGWKYIFIGADGLRAGWSLLLYCLLTAILSLGFYLARGYLKGGPQGYVGSALHLLPTAAALLLLAFILSRIERRPFRAYGLRRAHAIPDLVSGLVCGVAVLSLLIAALWLTGGLVFAAPNFAGAWRGAALAALAFLLVGFVEEFSFRGYLQLTLARGLGGALHWMRPSLANARSIGFWLAVAVFSGGFFVLAHFGNKGENLIGLASVAAAGFTFAYALYRTGALWWGIGCHAAWDWGESFLYGAADSGHVSPEHLFSVKPVGADWLSGGSAGAGGQHPGLPDLGPHRACGARRLPPAAKLVRRSFRKNLTRASLSLTL